MACWWWTTVARCARANPLRSLFTSANPGRPPPRADSRGSGMWQPLADLARQTFLLRTAQVADAG